MQEWVLSLTHQKGVQETLTHWSALGDVVARFVPARDLAELMPIISDQRWKGLQVSVLRLPDGPSAAPSTANDEQLLAPYRSLLAALEQSGNAAGSDISVKPSALGLTTDGSTARAEALVGELCLLGQRISTTVTLDAEPHLSAQTWQLFSSLVAAHPSLGLTLPVKLAATSDYCRELAPTTARVRLCKGEFEVTQTQGYTSNHDIDLAYVRCLRTLLAGTAYPLVATHDPRLVRIAQRLAHDQGRGPQDYEFQMIYGVRPWEQRRLVDIGHTMRTYLPYGPNWYDYYACRLAERPANAFGAVRAALGRR